MMKIAKFAACDDIRFVSPEAMKVDSLRMRKSLMKTDAVDG